MTTAQTAKTKTSKTVSNGVATAAAKKQVAPKSVVIDASGRTLGRVASEAAQHLLGKTSPDFMKNTVANIQVTINNANKLSLPERRIAGKKYLRYTGYPGGLIETPMAELIEKKGVREVIYRAVDGMIPRNKLRKGRMKRLTIND
jgi:large subunit ribosomal protein L13